MRKAENPRPCRWCGYERIFPGAFICDDCWLEHEYRVGRHFPRHKPGPPPDFEGGIQGETPFDTDCIELLTLREMGELKSLRVWDADEWPMGARAQIKAEMSRLEWQERAAERALR
jgi:hypothetical protein